MGTQQSLSPLEAAEFAGDAEKLAHRHYAAFSLRMAGVPLFARILRRMSNERNHRRKVLLAHIRSLREEGVPFIARSSDLFVLPDILCEEVGVPYYYDDPEEVFMVMEQLIRFENTLEVWYDGLHRVIRDRYMRRIVLSLKQSTELDSKMLVFFRDKLREAGLYLHEGNGRGRIRIYREPDWEIFQQIYVKDL